MAGRLVEIIPPRFFDFGWVGNGQEANIVLKRGIDISQWMSAGLFLRVHSMVGSAGNIRISAVAEAPTTDDPGAEFVASTALGTCNLGVAAPYCVETPLTPPFGASVRILVKAIGDGNPLNVMLGIDLALKNWSFVS